jgi:hypothetical protein
MHAIRVQDLVFLRACFQYHERFSLEMVIAACDEACRSTDIMFMTELLNRWGVPMTAPNARNHSLLWTAVAAGSVPTVRFLLSRCDEPIEWHDLAAVATLALGCGQEEIIDTLDCIVPLRRRINDLPIRTVCADGELYFWIFSQWINRNVIRLGREWRAVMKCQTDKPDVQELSLEDVLLFLCAQPHLVVFHNPSCRGLTAFACSMTMTCRNCRLPNSCSLIIHWTKDAHRFILRIRCICLCCLAGRRPIAPHPSRIVELLLVHAAVAVCDLPEDHPAHTLAVYVSNYAENLSAATRLWLRTFMSTRTQLRFQFVARHWVDFESLIGSLPGHVSLQTGKDPSKYPLSFRGEAIVTLTWVAPWTEIFLRIGLVQYVELDASFYAIRPYAYVVPFVVIANYGMPLGLIVSPTEREESYRLFDKALKRLGLPALVDLTPVLSDQGGGLKAYCKGHESSHFLCFRHLLESLGSHTYVAMLGRRLFFTSSEREYRELKAITILDFQIGCQEDAINAKGASRFRKLFGLSLDKDNRIIEDSVDPFRAQALWSDRGDRGVATCTNHSEGFHGRANRKVASVRHLNRRIAMLIDMLTKKHQHFSVATMNRSAKAMFATLTESAERGGLPIVSGSTGCPYHCGWDVIYANRFKIPHFPCRHTVLDPTLELDWGRHTMNLEMGRQDSVHEVIVISYEGPDWPMPLQIERKHGLLPIQDSEGSSVIGSADKFIRGLHAEFVVAFPHAQVMPPMQLSFEFGRFVTTRGSPDDLVLRSRFQLLMFRHYSRG